MEQNGPQIVEGDAAEQEEQNEQTETEQAVNAGGDTISMEEAVSEEGDESEEKAEKRRRPKRPCLFCGEFRADIRSHLLSAHKDEERVKKLKGLDKAERIRKLEILRKEGIFEKNKMLLASGVESTNLIPERKSDGDKVFCSSCKGTFRQTYFHKHKRLCVAAEQSGRPMKFVKNVQMDSFLSKVLDKMDRDCYFEIIQSDEDIKLTGRHIYATRKPCKEKDAIIKSRTAMRRIARLVATSENVTKASELFQVRNIYSLEDAIRKMCDTNSTSSPGKSGLKVALGSLLRKAGQDSRG